MHSGSSSSVDSFTLPTSLSDSDVENNPLSTDLDICTEDAKEKVTDAVVTWITENKGTDFVTSFITFFKMVYFFSCKFPNLQTIVLYIFKVN